MAAAFLVGSVSSSRGAVELEPRVVIEASFGGEPHEFAYDGIESSREPVVVVSCYTVTEDHILIFDQQRSEVKLYLRAGQFVKAIRTLWGLGVPNQHISATDIAVRDGVIYLLMPFLGWPGDDTIPWSEFQIFPFDLESGRAYARILCDDPGLSRVDIARGDTTFSDIGNVRFAESGNALALYDRRLAKRYVVINDTNLPETKMPEVNYGESSAGRYGLRENTYDPENPRIELVDESGIAIKTLVQHGGLLAISSDGDCFALGRLDWSTMKTTITIHDIEGSILSQTTPVASKAAWPFVTEIDRYKLSPDGILYGIWVTANGVQLLRWTP